MDLEEAAVDAVVVGDDQGGQLDVLVVDRLDRALQRRDDDVDGPQRLLFEARELPPELRPCRLGHGG